MYVKIYSPDGKLLTAEEVAKHANAVHQMSAKGNPYEASWFEDGNDRNFRLRGHMCDCGVNENVAGCPTNGEFKLMPLKSLDVIEGQKAYMVCQKCGCVSHL